MSATPTTLCLALLLPLLLSVLLSVTGLTVYGGFEGTKAITTACQNGWMVLRCPHANQVLSVRNSTYEYNNEPVCGSPYVAGYNCKQDVTWTVRNKCEGHKYCQIHVTNWVLGSSLCPDVNKYLVVDAECQQRATNVFYTQPNVVATVLRNPVTSLVNDFLSLRNPSPVYPAVARTLQREFVCENKKQVLKCPIGHTLRIHVALFGRDNVVDGGQCKLGRDNESLCSPNDVTATVNGLCAGLDKCDVTADVARFGDPCSGVYKYLKVEYSCLATTYAYSY